MPRFPADHSRPLSSLRRRGRGATAAVGAVAVSAAALAAVPTSPASANPQGTGLLISEVYGGGGNNGGAFKNDFIELFNPTTEEISLDGLGLQYRSASGGGGGFEPLSGAVAPGGYYLLEAAEGSNKDQPPLPTPDAVVPFSMSGSAGQVLLVDGTSAFTGSGDVAGNAGLVDALGWGSATTTFEGAPAAGTANATSVARKVAATDSDNNLADFAVGAPTPQNSGDDGSEPEPPAEPVEATIAEIQGTAAVTPLRGQPVVTRGLVTATYPTGGFNGFYIQTPGTGDEVKGPDQGSNAVFVFQGGGDKAYPAIGEYVEVTGTADEYNGQTQVNAVDGSYTVVDEVVAPVKARDFALPATTDAVEREAQRERYEGELVLPSETYTVTNNFSLNQYAEIGLALGDTPLITPSEIARPGDTEAIAQAQAQNAARDVRLDDGASIDFLSNKDIPLPWIDVEQSVRVNSSVQITEPVIFDWRNNAWKFQPTERLETTADGGPATFEDTRTDAPEDVGGDLTIATFNVLNYFTTTGEDWVAGGTGRECSYYTDRAGDRVTTNRCNPNGPRGAANDVNLERQESKIVAAIDAIDAGVVSLEEIENSAAFGQDRDQALSTLVDALNEAAGEERWAFVPSPSAVPTNEDVIRTAFIYQPDVVETVGESSILLGDPAFSNAREPLAQAFQPIDGGDPFTVVVNHFKSKSNSDAATGDNANNPITGAFNGDRVRQATALSAFADEFATEAGTEAVFLTGDFNSYSKEDPVVVLEDAGYTNLVSEGEWSYSFQAMSGSLDHVFANEAALATVTGSDVWEINAVEPISYEYSRYNYNATDFHAPNPYRSSDHEPHVVGISTGDDTPEPPAPGSIGTYQNVQAAYPYRYGGVGKPKRLAVWYGGRDGERITGRVYVTTRQLGSSSTTTASYWYDRYGRNVWTPLFSQRGSHQVTVSFVPSDPAYKSVSHSYWIWVSAR
ncbi:ExeM/NucH family extracellular endonuclease [Nocardioides zeae]|uniref:ExeM/NucH family extracellular endonuclease n=1 Tax=Nocardioides imazamoxiresistens TaxID=3231893 RepID=A0ABU3PTM0_9ACTN|nr:ExeM/NucH family extracellular endonuclease [Nocardioides zeae]MDT9592584.1 ExeM/NucH family extracellular endonuclease [Nocardioides zeae]